MMSRNHFDAFAKLARIRRTQAAYWEKAGDKEKADAQTYSAIGIEDAVIEVSKADNPRFDEARFRYACNPDSQPAERKELEELIKRSIP